MIYVIVVDTKQEKIYSKKGKISKEYIISGIFDWNKKCLNYN